MSTRRRVLLMILIIVTFVIGGRNLNKQEPNKENQIENFSDEELENATREFSELNKKMDKMIAQADLTIKYYQRLPQPTNEVKKSYHDGGHEDSFIEKVDKENGTVLVATVTTKMFILFKPEAKDFSRYNLGWMSPITLQCTKKKQGKCDFNYPYKLFASNRLVEVKKIIF